MTKLGFTLLLLCILYSLAFAQIDTVEYPKISSSIKIAYNSAFIYSGARLGFELPTRVLYKTKIKKSGKKKQVEKSQFLTINLGYYHHPTYHDNLYFTLGYTFRRISQKGFFTEFSPEIGYSRTTLGGTTYQVNSDNQIIIKIGAGYNHFIASLGGGIGYDFSKSFSKPYALFYKVNLLAVFPYNNSVHLRPTMELGIKFTPKKLFSRHIKTIIK